MFLGCDANQPADDKVQVAEVTSEQIILIIYVSGRVRDLYIFSLY